MRAEVWVHDRERRVLCQEEQGGIPAFAIINPATGKSDGYLVGHYEMPAMGWGKAGEMAEAIARVAGYRVEYDAPSLDWIEEAVW